MSLHLTALEEEALIVRLLDGNSDKPIQAYERTAARRIIYYIHTYFPGGLKQVDRLLKQDRQVKQLLGE